MSDEQLLSFPFPFTMSVMPSIVEGITETSPLLLLWLMCCVAEHVILGQPEFSHPRHDG